jgi:hypothetical protein
MNSRFSRLRRFGFCLLLASGAHAATAVDLYQDMEGGKDGDLLTPAIMSASSHPGAVGWEITGGPWFVSTRHAMNLPGPVTVGGVTYNGTNSTRCWMLNTSNAVNFIGANFGKSGGRSAITVAFYYTTDLSVRNYHIYDTVVLYGRSGTYACMQTKNAEADGPHLRAHSCDAKGTTFSPDMTKIVAGKTYWINLNYNADKGIVSLATFDPARAFAQVGTTLVSQSRPDKAPWRIWLGRADNHGNQTNDLSQSWFGDIMIDYTDAAFPLIPSNAAPSGAAAAK